ALIWAVCWGSKRMSCCLRWFGVRSCCRSRANSPAKLASRFVANRPNSWGVLVVTRRVSYLPGSSVEERAWLRATFLLVELHHWPFLLLERELLVVGWPLPIWFAILDAARDALLIEASSFVLPLWLRWARLGTDWGGNGWDCSSDLTRYADGRSRLFRAFSWI